MKKNYVWFLGAIGCVVISSVTWSAELLDSRSVLSALDHASTSAVKQSQGAKLLDDINKFREESSRLPTPQAMTRWFELLDQASSLGKGNQQAAPDGYDLATRSPVGVSSVLASLPPPNVWPSLRDEAVKRANTNHDTKHVATRLLFEFLNKDLDAAKGTLKQIESDAAALEPNERRMTHIAVAQVRATLVTLYGTPDDVINRLTDELDSSQESMFSPYVGIPDLVGMIGADRARIVLKKAVGSRSQLRVESGEETRKLARTIALENIQDMQVPQWGLIDSIEAADLYEAIAKKFSNSGAKKPDREDEYSELMYSKREAAVYYLLNAIVNHRQEVAEATLLEIGENNGFSLPSEAVYALQRAHQSEALVTFLHGMLQAHPELEAWDTYLEQSSYTGHSRTALALIQSLRKRTDLPARAQAELHRHLVSALLAANRTDEAIAELARQIKSPPRIDEKGLVFRIRDAIRLATIGRLLNRPALTNDALAFSADALQLNYPEFDIERRGLVESVWREYRKTNNPRAAQEIAVRELQRDSRTASAQYQENYGIAAPNPEKVSALVELVGIYSAAGRDSDAIALLDNATQWGARDLRDIFVAKDSLGVPLGQSVAQSLVALSKPKEAALILWQLLDELPGYDPAYALLVKIGGDDLARRFDSLAGRDRFEERPLIWQAQVLFSSGQIDNAESVVRRAISIDPSDGDEGPGDRLRAYALLANILEAKQDPKSATTYRAAVAAIRQSEHADEFYAVGMFDRAFAGYREALDRFSDAYCIQSRLAIQLTKQGRYAEAADHYRRAYELMPDSFGRVESHCFGCESVFKDSSAQNLAEEVFQGALRRDRQKPQVHYLLGYLYEEEGRYSDALQAYRDAVALDPDYLNAWKHLDGLSAHTYIEPFERDIAALKMLELDPQQRHVQVNVERIGDFSQLWRAVDKAHTSDPKRERIYGLTKSSKKYDEAQRKLPPEIREQMEQYQSMMEQMKNATKIPPANAVIAKNSLILSVGALMGAQISGYGAD